MTVDHDHRMATEVAVTAQVALDRTTRLVRTTNFITTSEDMLYVLVDANASILDDVAYGAIVVDADEADRVSDWLTENATSVGGAGPALTITGLLSGRIRADMVDGALTDRGMVKSPDFFYITPHFDGREAALTPQPFAGFWSAAWVYAIAAFFLALGAFKFALRDRYPQVARTSPHVEAAHSHEAAYQIADRLIDEDIARANRSGDGKSPDRTGRGRAAAQAGRGNVHGARACISGRCAPHERSGHQDVTAIGPRHRPVAARGADATARRLYRHFSVDGCALCVHGG